MPGKRTHMPPSRTVAAPLAAGLSPGVPLASSRSAATNRPISRWSPNTSTGRRCRDLFRGYMRALGDPADEPTVALAIAAAESVTLAEVARAECLGGMTGITAELTIRFENSAARALRRLGLNKPVPAPRKTFMEKMAEKEAALRAAESAAAAERPKGGAE
jgi:hypothetical protein